jgi:hypothetical protein
MSWCIRRGWQVCRIRRSRLFRGAMDLLEGRGGIPEDGIAGGRIGADGRSGMAIGADHGGDRP